MTVNLLFFFLSVTTCTCLHASQSNRGSSSLSWCLKLKGSQPSILVTRDSNQKRYNRLNDQTGSLLPFVRPLGYVVVKSAYDVSSAVICARELNIHIVVRGGGHSYAKYSFGDNSTVIIDLRKLNEINVNRYTKTATVGPGVLLAHLYWGVWSQSQGSLGFPAGMCLTVGMGQPLGGGQGSFHKAFGLASDNIVEYEMVDANGFLRIVNKDTNRGLFWALRGAGGGNFGIITSLKLKLFEAKDLKFKSIIFNYRLSEFAAVFQAWDTWNEQTKMKAVFSDITVESGGFSLLISDFDYNLEKSEMKKLMEKFGRRTVGDPIIKSENFIEFIAFNLYAGVNITELSELGDVKREDVKKDAFLVKSYFVDKTISLDDNEKLGSLVTRMPEGVEIFWEPYGGAVNRVKSEDTAFVHRNSLYNIELKVFSTETKVMKYVRDFDGFALKTLDNGESYQNYADWQLKDYLVRYYGTNLQRLVKIKRQVDPQNIFNFPQSIPTFL